MLPKRICGETVYDRRGPRPCANRPRVSVGKLAYCASHAPEHQRIAERDAQRKAGK